MSLCIRIVALSALTLSPFAFASEEPQIITVGGGGAADLLGITRFPPEFTGTTPKRTMDVNCRDDSGQTLTPHEPGYQSCMLNLRAAEKGAKSADSSTSGSVEAALPVGTGS